MWSPETARREAKSQLGRVAHGDDPAGEREEDRKALTIKQLCEQYIADMEAGLILGKGGRPKKDTTIATDPSAAIAAAAAASARHGHCCCCLGGPGGAPYVRT